MKKLFFIFAFIILMVILFKANIFNFDEVVSVKETIRCKHDGIEWMLQIYSDGEIAISPIGDIPQNLIVPGTIDGHTITKVADYAFSGYRNLKTIELASTISSVGSYAFWDCESLVSVIFESENVSIEKNAFTGCSEKLIEKVKKTNPNIQWK